MRVFVATADASGDLHGSALLRALRPQVRQLEAFGLGGRALEAAGLETLVPQSDLAVGGLVEVFRSAPALVRGYTRLRRALRERRPHLALLIDSPDLNLRLAAVARRAGVPVLYYIAPQVWAWRPGRACQLARRCDEVAVIFPFEEPLLRESGVRATFVGHPLVDRIAALRAQLQPKEMALELGFDPERPLLGLLPGSRRNELRANLPLMLRALELLRPAHPGLQVQLPLAPTLAAQRLELPPDVTVVTGRTHEAMAISTCLLAAPGTVTVEATLLGVPLVVTHRMSSVSFEIFRRMARVPSSSMTNLIADAGVVPERIQQLARPAALAALVSGLLRDPAARAQLRDALQAVARKLGPPGAAERAANLALRVASPL